MLKNPKWKLLISIEQGQCSRLKIEGQNLPLKKVLKCKLFECSFTIWNTHEESNYKGSLINVNSVTTVALRH